MCWRSCNASPKSSTLAAPITMPWDKLDHDFTFPQLSYEATSNFQPCIKVSVFFKKLDSIDYDTFFGHWQTVHADLAVATQAFRAGIERYVQVRVATRLRLPLYELVSQAYHCSITKRRK